jgi:hypothetical protein
MSQTQNDSGIGTYQAGATITRGQRVAISTTTGTLEVAGGGVPLDLGIAMADAASGAFLSVAYVTKPGTFVASVTGVPITAGSALYGITGGQLSTTTTGSTVTWGIALEAATSNGSLIEVLRVGNA